MTDTDQDVPRSVAPKHDPGSTPPTRARRHVDYKSLGEVAALIVLVVVFSVLNSDTFPTIRNLRTILDQASLPLIIGVGATLVILMGSIDLSVEGVMGVSGMTFVLLSANTRDTADLGLLAVAVAVAVGVALGLATGLIHTRLKVPTFIVTLGMWYVGLGLATLLFGESSIPSLTEDSLTAWPTLLTAGLPRSFLLAAVVVLIGVTITRFTRLGRSAYAIGNNEDVARGNGVRVANYKVYVFMVAGGCSALAGVLASLQLGAGSATVGIGMLFITIPAVVIGGTALGGGKGGVMRTALGVALLTVLNNGLILSGVSPNIQSGVQGLVLVVAIIAAAWAYRDRLRVVK